MSIMCWLWPLLAGIICGILGYLLGSSLVREWKDKYTNLELDLENCKRANRSLEAELNVTKPISNNAKNGLTVASDAVDVDSLQEKIVSLQDDLKKCTTEKEALKLSLESNAAKSVDVSNSLTAAAVAVSNFDASVAKTFMGKKVKEDDLKVVEGIGPKIEGLFHNFDIKTWKLLSETSVKKCQEVLDSGGDRYRIHKPNTWPQQAKLAYEGKWEELKKLQDKLNGGKL